MKDKLYLTHMLEKYSDIFESSEIEKLSGIMKQTSLTRESPPSAMPIETFEELEARLKELEQKGLI